MPFKEDVNSFRERVNLKIYGGKSLTLRIFRILSTLFSLSALGVALYYYGYPQTMETKELVFDFFRSFFVFYILHFAVRYFFDFHPSQFFKDHWLETILTGILLIEGMSDLLTGELLISALFKSLGIYSFSDLTAVGVILYILVGVLFDFTQSTRTFIQRKKLHPATIFISIFVTIILLGTGMLMLPEMTVDGIGMNTLDALFTSTSATCVTGLIVEDTATFFTFKGQLVILSLIKLGGLNIISFAAFMALFIKLGIGVKQHELIEDFMNKQSILSNDGLFGRIFFLALFIEILGSIGIFALWPDTIPFENLGEKIFHSIFHSISAFNNAGFSLFTENLAIEEAQKSFPLFALIGLLIVVGGLGMTALRDMFSFELLRERLSKPWKTYTISTKIALYTSIGLTIAGLIVFLGLEHNNTLDQYDWTGKTIHALFSSITTRTAGFNTINFGELSMATLLFVMLLMFIGASPGSTGGGIKTTTFFVLISSTIATLQGKKNIEFAKRSIPSDIVYKAFSVLVFSLAGIMIGTFILSITEAHILEDHGRGLIDLLFEEISAFSTVGLSMGITESLSNPGKLVIILSMFVGRIGTLTLGFALARNLSDLKYKYPNAHLMVG